MCGCRQLSKAKDNVQVIRVQRTDLGKAHNLDSNASHKLLIAEPKEVSSQEGYQVGRAAFRVFEIRNGCHDEERQDRGDDERYHNLKRMRVLVRFSPLMSHGKLTPMPAISGSALICTSIHVMFSCRAHVSGVRLGQIMFG